MINFQSFEYKKIVIQDGVIKKGPAELKGLALIDLPMGYSSELEFNLTNNQGNPVFTHGGESVYQTVRKMIKTHYGETKANRFVAEALANMIEFNGKIYHSIDEVFRQGSFYHQIISRFAEQIDLVISDKQAPIGKYRPQGPREYPYASKLVDIFEFRQRGLGYKAGTTSMHTHIRNETKYKDLNDLITILARLQNTYIINQNIYNDPKHRYKSYGMSKDRHDARSKLVEQRRNIFVFTEDIVQHIEEQQPLNLRQKNFLGFLHNKNYIPVRTDDLQVYIPYLRELQESLYVSGDIDECILDKGQRSVPIQDEFIKRYYPNNERQIGKPQRDHGPVVIKKPGRYITTEHRLSDGPGSNPSHIKTQLELIQTNHFQALSNINYEQGVLYFQ